ncbi:hypothetical protein GCM10022245_15370 [Streptomyces mayteni]
MSGQAADQAGRRSAVRDGRRPLPGASRPPQTRFCRGPGRGTRSRRGRAGQLSQHLGLPANTRRETDADTGTDAASIDDERQGDMAYGGDTSRFASEDLETDRYTSIWNNVPTIGHEGGGR